MNDIFDDDFELLDGPRRREPEEKQAWEKVLDERWPERGR